MRREAISNDGNESTTEGLSKSKRFSSVSFSMEPKGKMDSRCVAVQLIRNHGTSSGPV